MFVVAFQSVVPQKLQCPNFTAATINHLYDKNVINNNHNKIKGCHSKR